MRKRYRASNKVKRDGWVRQMVEDMPQLTQADVAKRFGLNQSAVSRILKNTPALVKAKLLPTPQD